MRNPFFCLFLLLLIGCQAPKEEKTTDAGPQDDALAALRETFAPDARTARLSVAWDPAARSYSGYVTDPAAHRALTALDAELFADVRLLPATRDSLALVRVSVANLRSRPGHSQELATQALLGTPLRVLLEDNHWFLVQTPDDYLAWLEPGAFTVRSPEAAAAWFAPGLLRYLPAQGFAYATPDAAAEIVSELVAGNLLRPTERRRGRFQEVAFPDGRRAFVPTAELAPTTDWSAAATPDELLATARTLRGRPYFWGGTSPKAMDCSGFTKTAYYLNGYVIPRDASQQVHAGEEVPLDGGFAQLEPADLLFFGNLRDDGSQRITHVGFYLGEGRFLHAGADNGYVTENSLVAGAADFAPHRLKSLLRAKRLRPGGKGVTAVEDLF